MAVVEKPLKRTLPMTPCGSLPPQVHLLIVTSARRTAAWLAEALASDRATAVLLEEVVGPSAALTRIGEQTFDAVLISHEPAELDALELVEGMRGGGSEEPIVVLGDRGADEMSAYCYEVGADAYLCMAETTTRTLLWTIARAIEHHKLLRENRLLAQGQKRRLAQEQGEAERLLAQQWALVRQVEPAADNFDAAAAKFEIVPRHLRKHYGELLRAHVIMGTGSLNSELSALCGLLVASGLTERQALQLHVESLEELVRGLGNRSARHVMNRADLLIVEVLLHLAAGYRAPPSSIDP